MAEPSSQTALSGSESTSTLDSLLARRWCLTDGEGGYACGNAALLLSSLSDGLLVTAVAPPVGRHVLLARLEETVRISGQDVPFSTQRYLPDQIAPEGFSHLVDFQPAPFPTWRIEVPGAVLERQIFGLRGRSLVGIVYRLIEAEGPVRLTVRPFLAFRRLDEPTFENPAAVTSAVVEADTDSLCFSLYPGVPPLHLSSGMAFEAGLFWYKRFCYPGAEPGFDWEDLPTPGFFEGELAPGGQSQVILASTAAVSFREWEDLRTRELLRREQVLLSFPARSEGELDNLISRSEEFLAGREKSGAGVMADLTARPHDGRAALMGLRGLALLPQRYDTSRLILSTIASEFAHGFIPSEHREWEAGGDLSGYDTLLWFPIAAWSYLLYTDDLQFVRSKLFWTLVEIGGQIQRGLPGLRMDRVDNLLVVGEDDLPHTWMNAVDPEGKAVTLRRGKPVEINALWFNACECLKEICARLGRSDLMRGYRTLSLRIRESFPVAFWNARSRCLYDVVGDETRDDSIRPNQLLALSLPFRLIEGDKAESVLKVVERELLTPWGLRSLSPRCEGYTGSEDPGILGRGEHLRHQGSVYPWLLGSFISAHARLHGTEVGFSRLVLDWMSALLSGDPTALHGHLRERYDGDAPHTPRGSLSSALNVGELLRAYVEEVLEYPAFNMRPARGFEG